MSETVWPGEEITDDHWPGAVIDSGQDYDFRAAVQAGETPDASGHWTDKFKKPNHPTFSDESIYAGSGNPGHWNGNQFIPPSSAGLPDHSDQWNQTQRDLATNAQAAGIPSATDSRQRLMDAIGRTEGAGFKTPHFIGQPNEPTGDRGVTRDIENLVSSLKQQEATIAPGPVRDALSRQRAYWEQEAASGMSADEWKSQTGEADPLYPHEQNFTGQLSGGHYLDALKTGLGNVMKLPARAAYGIGTVGMYQPTDQQLETPLVSPEIARAIMKAPFLASGINQTESPVRGVLEGVGNVASGATTPENIALLGIAPEGKLAQRLIAGTFLGQSLLGTPEQWQAFKDAPTAAEKTRIGVEMGLGLALPAAGLSHSFTGARPESSGLRSSETVTKTDIPVQTTQEAAKADIPAEATSTAQASAGQRVGLSESPYSLVRDRPPGPQSLAEAQGLPAMRSTSQRFRQPDGAPVLDPSQTTAQITRDAVAWRSALVEEGQRLGVQARIIQGQGMRLPIPLERRINEINAELQRGYQPQEPQHYELRGKNAGVQSETATVLQAPAQTVENQGVEVPLREPVQTVSALPENLPQPEPTNLAQPSQGFVPSTQWQEIPEGAVLPNGGEFRMDQTTGKNYARYSEAALAEIQRRNAPGENISRESKRTSDVSQTDALKERPQAEPHPMAEARQDLQTDSPQPENNPTSTKNASTHLERESRGIAPAVEAARRDFGTVWDEAEAATKQDPTAPQRLVESIRDNPRTLSDHENALLLRRQIEVQNEHTAAIDALNSAPDSPEAISRLESARNDLQTVYDAAKAAGTETGRGLNARRMLANNDFTLAKMEAETRAVANNGRALSPKQASEVKALHQRIHAAEEKISAYEAREQFRNELQVSRKSRVAPQTFLENQAAKARERIIARRGQLFSDPVGVTQIAHLADEAIIGAAHIARGVRTFGDWSRVMISELGERIKPFLKALYAKANQMHSEAARSRLSPEQREVNALAGEKKGIITRTEKLRAKTEAGDFERAPKKQPRMDHEKSLLLYEYQKAKEAYLQGLMKSKLARQSFPRKALRYGAEVLNTGRAIMTSFDLSAVLRQGGFTTFGHPIMALKNFPDMIRAFGSEKAQFRINEELKNRSNAPLYKQSGLFVADDSGASLSKMEEAYMSRWAKKIPVVAGSERAYVTFLNKIRADSFDSMYKNLGGKERVSPVEAKAIANFVNVTTGRGNMGGAAQAAVALNTAFFAPRYVVSRFQTLLGQPMYGGTMRTRFAVAKEYARFLAGAATVYALAKGAGATVETDPRSSDFGKLKFGNTRVDPLAGLSQTTVLMSRLGAGETKTGAGKIVPIRGDKVPYGTGNSADVIARFLRTKLSPAIGGAVDLLAGKNVVGQPVTAASTAKQMVIPLSFGDIAAAMKEQGVERGTALAILALFGMGVNNYAPKQPKSERKLTLDEAMRKRRTKQVQTYLNGAR